jgi:multiple sugar transport system ATP-binding protein
MVFQNYALYPHMTVAENMGFALKMHRIHKDERARRVLEAAKHLGLEEYFDRTNSNDATADVGGNRQRRAHTVPCRPPRRGFARPPKQ